MEVWGETASEFATESAGSGRGPLPTLLNRVFSPLSCSVIVEACGAPGLWRMVAVVRGNEISGRPVFRAREITQDVEIFEEPTGWPKVDRQVEELRLRLREATTEEQFQSVGLLCREVLISLALAVYDRERYPPPVGVKPSTADAKRMLDAFFSVELAGAGYANARKHQRAAFDLANEVQHDRTASFRDAALCAEATVSVKRIVTIVSGRRERTDLGS